MARSSADYFGYAAMAALVYVAWQLARGESLIDLAQSLNPAAKVAEAITPTNRENVFASGVNAAGKVLVADDVGPGMNADDSWSLGAWIYDVTHKNPLAANTGGATGRW